MIPALSYRGVDAVTATSGSLHDEFVQTADTSQQRIYGGDNEGLAQSWQSGGSPSEVTGVVFRLMRANEVEGTLRAAVYAHSGTYGTSSVPSGAALVVSNEVAADSIATSATNYFFALSGWTPSASTNYTVVLEHNIPHGAVANGMSAINEDGAEATHAGNLAILGASSWSAQSAQDLAFKVYYTAASDDFELRIRDGTYRRRYAGWGAV